MNEIIGEYERYPFPFNSKLGLEVSKDMPKIYMKELKTRNEINLCSEIFHFSAISTGCWYQEQVMRNATLENPVSTHWEYLVLNVSRFI